jgi:putative addiction module antidote
VSVVDSYNICCYIPLMTIHLKLTAIGNSVGLILPKEVLARLGVGKGDVLSGVETTTGLELRAYDPDFEAQMDVARKIMHKRRAVLRELAK